MSLLAKMCEDKAPEHGLFLNYKQAYYLQSTNNQPTEILQLKKLKNK